MVDVSVIVPVYNRSRLIESCVRTLVRQKVNFTYEIILVDDCSTDDTHLVLESWKKRFPNLIRLTRTQRNGGPGVARNQGIKIARADILAFTDSDCEAEPSWLSNLTRTIRSGEEQITLGVPAGLPGNIWQELQQESYDAWVGNVVKSKYAQSFDTRNCAVHRDVFNAVGLMSRIRILHDTDLGCRFLNAGYRIRYASDAVIKHYHRGDFTAIFKNVYNLHKDMLTILVRHPSWLRRNRFFLVSFGAGMVLLSLIVLMPVGILHFPLVYAALVGLVVVGLAVSKMKRPLHRTLARVVFSAVYGITMCVGTLAGIVRAFHEKNETYERI